MRPHLYIIKIGGNVLDHPEHLQQFLKDFSTLQGHKILVHGGGKIASRLGEKLGIVSQYHQGRRITDAETLDLVTMVYGGLVNKQLVAQLQALNCNAIGISGADANLIPATKRSANPIDFGWVGDPLVVNPLDAHHPVIENWTHLLQKNWSPIVAPLTHDQQGHLLNTNADTIAAVIARALCKMFQVRLIFCFEKAGVLEDVNDEHSVIPVIDQELKEKLLAEGKLFEGMLPKINNAFEAVEAGVEAVVIGDARNLPLLCASGQALAGTTIRLKT